MKKLEFILGLFALASIVFSVTIIIGGEVLVLFSLGLLATFYMYFSFALFNEIGFRGIFKSSSYKEISSARIIGAILTGFALCITIIGLLFKFQSWPGALMNIILGVFGLTIALVVGSIKYAKTKSNYYIKIFKRIAVYGGLGLAIILLPKTAWVEFKYRNYPNYINAYKEAAENPTNEELWKKANDEREKIYETLRTHK